MPQVSELMAPQAIAELRAEGIELTLAEVIELNARGLAVEQPKGETANGLRGSPVRVGNVVLWPLTVAADRWWYDVAVDAFRTEDGQTIALSFAMAHGRKPDVFAELLTADDCKRAVNSWALRCGARIEELRAAIPRVRPSLTVPHVVELPEEQKADGVTMDEAIADLVAWTGLPAEHWAAQPVDSIGGQLRAVYAQVSAGVATTDEQREIRRLNWEFQAFVEAIRKSRKAATSG